MSPSKAALGAIPLRRSFFQADLAPKTPVRQRHAAFHFVALNREAKSAAREFAAQGLLRGIVAALHRAHGHGLAVHDFVQLHGKPAWFFDKPRDVTQRILVVARAFSHHANGIAAPIANNDGVVRRGCLALARAAAGRNENHESHDRKDVHGARRMHGFLHIQPFAIGNANVGLQNSPPPIWTFATGHLDTSNDSDRSRKS